MRNLAVCLLAGLATAATVMVALNGATAYDVDSSGSFNIAAVSGTSTIYSGTSKTLGIRVSVDTGTAVVEDLSGGSTETLGTVTAGTFCVFEGTFTSVRVKATTTGGASGTYENREITSGGADADGIIGEGSITLIGSPVQVYKKGSGAHRAICVTVSSGTIGLRTSSGGADIITITAGDGGTIDDESVTGFFLSGTGTAEVEIQKPTGTPAWGEYVNNNADSDDDEDDLDLPGSSTCFEYQVKNTGEENEGKITVKYKFDGENTTEQTSQVDPGDTVTFSCDMVYVKVVFEKAAGSCTWRKRVCP